MKKLITVVFIMMGVLLTSCSKDKCEYSELDGFPFSCDKGMDVAFLIDYTATMTGAIDSLKSQVNNIADSIDVLSGSNYQLSLSIFDEADTSFTPNYVSQATYSGLPAAQKIINTSWPTKNQYLTVMEPFSLNNKSSFSTQLAKLNVPGTMNMGNGWGVDEPGGLLLNEILEPKTFAGNWRSSNITKIAIIITDAPAGGDDDLANATDDAYLAALAAQANPGGGGSGTQVLLISSLPTSNYEIHLVDNNTGGLKLMNADFSNIAQDVIDLIDDICINNGG